MTTTITDHVDTWTSTDRSLSVVIETLPPERPVICVTFGDGCETWDDLTADQARSLGAFLGTALKLAADRLDTIGD